MIAMLNTFTLFVLLLLNRDVKTARASADGGGSILVIVHYLIISCDVPISHTLYLKSYVIFW